MLQQTTQISNNVFRHNRATFDGGSLTITRLNSEVKFFNCTFVNSTCTKGVGGAAFLVANQLAKFKVDVRQCRFTHNGALRGGAIFSRFLWLSLSVSVFSHTHGESVAQRPRQISKRQVSGGELSCAELS